MAKSKEKAKPGTLGKVLRYIGRYKLLLPISIFFALVSVALTLYIPIIIGEVIDLIALFEDGEAMNWGAIASKLGLAAILIGITALSQWLMSTVNNRIAFHVVRDIRNDAFKKVTKLPLSYIDTHSHGDTVNRVINDADQFAEGLLLGFTQLFTGVLTIVGTLFFMLTINWIIALVVVVLTPMSLLVARFIGSRTHSMFGRRSKSEAEATSLINEMIGNQKAIKAFGYEDDAVARFGDANKQLEADTLQATFFSSLVNPTTRFLSNVVYAAVALVGAFLAISTKDSALAFTVGNLSTLLAYTNQYTKPFNEISGVIAEFQNALACASRVLDLIEAEPEPSDEGAAVIGVADGRIDIENMSFSYTDEKPLIENMSLEVEPGMRVAIVGPTGCGKTTLINLLMRFYDVKEGSIRLDGKDIRKLTRHSLRENYGMVLQDTWLKAGTIRENIIMGKPDATDEEIVAAAKAAHSHSFIKRLKNGYDTVIGEGGEGLSQGQKQLLCITRVMLAPPPVLILDEATSSIDTRTEIRIQKAFAELMRGRTSFIVAHRLSTIKEADIILVMKDGNIVEKGTHDELLSRGGFYSHLYNSQFAH